MDDWSCHDCATQATNLFCCSPLSVAEVWAFGYILARFLWKNGEIVRRSVFRVAMSKFKVEKAFMDDPTVRYDRVCVRDGVLFSSHCR